MSLFCKGSDDTVLGGIAESRQGTGIVAGIDIGVSQFSLDRSRDYLYMDEDICVWKNSIF